jgi:hypothetical protein
METPKISIESDGTVKGTVVKLNDVAIGLIQEITFSAKADPDNIVQARIRYWKAADHTGPSTLDELKLSFSGMYSVYATPFTGNLTLENEPVQFIS